MKILCSSWLSSCSNFPLETGKLSKLKWTRQSSTSLEKLQLVKQTLVKIWISWYPIWFLQLQLDFRMPAAAHSYSAITQCRCSSRTFKCNHCFLMSTSLAELMIASGSWHQQSCPEYSSHSSWEQSWLLASPAFSTSKRQTSSKAEAQSSWLSPCRSKERHKISRIIDNKSYQLYCWIQIQIFEVSQIFRNISAIPRNWRSFKT